MTVTGWPTAPVIESGCGDGGSLTSVTVMLTVAGADSSCVSFVLNTNESVPWKSGAGV